MILGRLEVGEILVNCYMLGDVGTREAAVIDPGGDVDAILGYLAGKGLRLKYILNTHAHFDHVGANRALREATGAPILIHQEESPWLEGVEERAARHGIRAQNSHADGDLHAGDRLQVGSIPVDVLEFKGHSFVRDLGFLFRGDPEQKASDEKRPILICGDVLFAGSIGRTDFPGGNLRGLLESIRSTIFPLPDDTLILPGHGPQTTLGEEKRSNPFL